MTCKKACKNATSPLDVGLCRARGVERGHWRGQGSSSLRRLRGAKRETATQRTSCSAFLRIAPSGSGTVKKGTRKVKKGTQDHATYARVRVAGRGSVAGRAGPAGSVCQW